MESPFSSGSSSPVSEMKTAPILPRAELYDRLKQLSTEDLILEDPASIDDAPVKVSPRSRAIITLIFCLGMMSSGLDFNVLGDASPYIALHFSTFDKINWMSTATLLAALGTLLLTSKLMDFVETKFFFILGLFLMAIGEVLAGASTSFNMLLLGRFFSGLSAPIILVVGTTVTGMIWNSKMRPFMISIVIASYGVMIKVGPLVAGALLKKSISLWRWCFYLQLPILGLLILMTLVLFPRIGRTDQTSFARVVKQCALPGLCQAIGLISLMFPLVIGGTSYTYRWSGPSLVICYILTPILLSIFVIAERRNAEEDRFLPWEAFEADRSVVLMGVITFCSMFTIFGATFYLPIMYQLVFGSSALLAAVQLLPNAVAGTVATVFVGKIAEKTGHFIPSCIILSVVQVIGGLLCAFFQPTTPLWIIYLFTAVGGVGAGGLASIGSPFTLEKIPLKRYGAGAAFSNLCLLLGAGFGVASLGIILAHKMEAIVPQIHVLEPDLALGENIWSNLITLLYASAAVQALFRKAFMDAMDVSGILFGIVGFISLIASLAIRKQKMHQHGDQSISKV